MYTYMYIYIYIYIIYIHTQQHLHMVIPTADGHPRIRGPALRALDKEELRVGLAGTGRRPTLPLRPPEVSFPIPPPSPPPGHTSVRGNGLRAKVVPPPLTCPSPHLLLSLPPPHLSLATLP